MSMPDMVTGSRRAMKNLYTPPAMVPERPSASSMAAVSRSKLVWPEVAEAGGGVSVASSADRTARARSAASPWPAMWVHQIGGDCSSRCLCSAVCCRPPACTASVTEASSSSVTTRSPISMVCPSGCGRTRPTTRVTARGRRSPPWSARSDPSAQTRFCRRCHRSACRFGRECRPPASSPHRWWWPRMRPGPAVVGFALVVAARACGQCQRGRRQQRGHTGASSPDHGLLARSHRCAPGGYRWPGAGMRRC